MLQRLQYKSNNRADSYQHCLKRWAGEAASSFDDPSRLTDTQISQAASETRRRLLLEVRLLSSVTRSLLEVLDEPAS